MECVGPLGGFVRILPLRPTLSKHHKYEARPGFCKATGNSIGDMHPSMPAVAQDVLRQIRRGLTLGQQEPVRLPLPDLRLQKEIQSNLSPSWSRSY